VEAASQVVPHISALPPMGVPGVAQPPPNLLKLIVEPSGFLAPLIFELSQAKLRTLPDGRGLVPYLTLTFHRQSSSYFHNVSEAGPRRLAGGPQRISHRLPGRSVPQRLTHQVGLPICKGSVHLPACAHGVQAAYALQTAQPGFKLRRDGCAHVNVMIRLYYVRPSIYLDAGIKPAGARANRERGQQ
jgi:hypothetical protein